MVASRAGVPAKAEGGGVVLTVVIHTIWAPKALSPSTLTGRPRAAPRAPDEVDMELRRGDGVGLVLAATVSKGQSNHVLLHH